MQGLCFDVANTSEICEQIFERLSAEAGAQLYIGPYLTELIMKRQRDQSQSLEFFVNTIKYAHLCFFRDNILSAFCGRNISSMGFSSDHFEALRMLPSFQRHAEKLLDQKKAAKVRALLENDEALFEEAISQRTDSKASINWVMGALQVLKAVRSILDIKPVMSFSTLYIKGFSGHILGTAVLREVTMRLKQASIESLSLILTDIVDILMVMPPTEYMTSPDDFRDLLEQLDHVATAEATISAGKGRRSNLTKDSATSTIKVTLVSLLETYFEEALINVEDLTFNETLFYDNRSSYREVFMPRPKAIIERALSSPHDYLGCQCCASEHEGLQATQPAISILYGLYLESGSQINVHDLWTAFSAVTDPEQNHSELSVFLFVRSLAKLKHMGMIRQSGRKVDHLAKLAWKGL